MNRWVVMVVLQIVVVCRVAAQPAPAASRVLGEGSSEDAPLFQCKKAEGPFVVSLKAETDVKDLVAWVMGFTCKSFLLDPRIVATGRKVSIVTPNKMTASAAYQVFLGALATINLTVVRRGEVWRIVESPAARKEALPLFKKGMPDDVDQVVRYVYKPSYAAAELLRQAFQALKSDAGDAVAVGSLLLITDYASNVREMLSVAKLVDVPGGSDGIYTLPVRHADAAKLTEKLNAILNLSSTGAAPARLSAADPRSEPGKADAGRPDVVAVPSKIVVDERTNTLVIVSGEAGYQRVKALVDRLDIALEIDGGGSIHVVPLGSAVADELAKTLTAAISDSRAPRPPAGPGAAPTSSPSSASPASASAPSAAGGSAGPNASLGASLEGQVRVIADPPTNSLIVMSSGRDFLALKEVIRQLDRPRREVYIEVMILEVDAGSDMTLGTVAHGGSPIGGEGAVLFGGVKANDVSTLPSVRPDAAAGSPGILSALQNATGLFSGVVGPSKTLLGQSIPSYAVLFQAVAQHTGANIISAPSIIAIDNVEAKYKVGTKIPVSKGTVLTPFGSGAVPQSSVESVEFPLKLELKPHISDDDMVLLEVKHEADQLVNETERGPVSSTRAVETRVVVRDQQTVVLGGLTQERESQSTAKVPLLGDIPLLGYLFKTTTRSKHKTNLLIMLTPYIIRDQRDLQAIHERRIREHDEFARSVSALDHLPYDPHINYRKKRGLLEEINRAVQDVEQDAAMRRGITQPPRVEAGRVDAEGTEP